MNRVVSPKAGRRRRCDSYTALPLLNHPIHVSSAIVDIADFMLLAGIKQNAFSGRCFAASMCAMMPMFRTCSIPYSRGIYISVFGLSL